MSNFQKVVEFNKTFGVTLHNSVQNNIFDLSEFIKDDNVIYLQIILTSVK